MKKVLKKTGDFVKKHRFAIVTTAAVGLTATVVVLRYANGQMHEFIVEKGLEREYYALDEI